MTRAELLGYITDHPGQTLDELATGTELGRVPVIAELHHLLRGGLVYYKEPDPESTKLWFAAGKETQ